MKILRIILDVILLGLGVIFIVLMATDIQLGFGIVLLAIGLQDLLRI